MSATNRGSERISNDVYCTPKWVVNRLLDGLDLPSGRWLEPCGGEGNIIQAVNEHPRYKDDGIVWTAAEIRPECEQPLLASGVSDDRLFIGDFLSMDEALLGRYAVTVTNPPFALAQEFVEKCLRISDHVVFLLRLNYLASGKRSEFMRNHTPDVLVLPNRPSFVNGKTDATDYCWMYWSHRDYPKYGCVRILGDTPRKERK